MIHYAQCRSCTLYLVEIVTLVHGFGRLPSIEYTRWRTLGTVLFALVDQLISLVVRDLVQRYDARENDIEERR